MGNQFINLKFKQVYGFGQLWQKHGNNMGMAVQQKLSCYFWQYVLSYSLKGISMFEGMYVYGCVGELENRKHNLLLSAIVQQLLGLPNVTVFAFYIFSLTKILNSFSLSFIATCNFVVLFKTRKNSDSKQKHAQICLIKFVVLIQVGNKFRKK